VTVGAPFSTKSSKMKTSFSSRPMMFSNRKNDSCELPAASE